MPFYIRIYELAVWLFPLCLLVFLGHTAHKKNTARNDENQKVKKTLSHISSFKRTSFRKESTPPSPNWDKKFSTHSSHFHRFVWSLWPLSESAAHPLPNRNHWFPYLMNHSKFPLPLSQNFGTLKHFPIYIISLLFMLSRD